jgi:hypothetical protein
MRFQQLDVLGDGGLGHRQRARGLGEAAGLDDADEGANGGDLVDI